MSKFRKPPHNIFGKNIEFLRKKHGLTLHGLAEVTGIPISCLHDLIKGRTPLDLTRIVTLAEVFEVSERELIAKELFDEQRSG